MNFVVSVDRTRNTSKIAHELRSAGMVVSQEMPCIGVISGFADDEVLPDLRHVRGVLYVEVEGAVQIAPPSSPIQ